MNGNKYHLMVTADLFRDGDFLNRTITATLSEILLFNVSDSSPQGIFHSPQ